MTQQEIIAAVTGNLSAEVRCAADQNHGVTLDVPASQWLGVLAFARDRLDCDFFDWLTAVDEQDKGLQVVVHLYSLAGRHHTLVRTLVPRTAPVLPTATGLYRGAAWHERETHEMFGIDFAGHPNLAPLLLPAGFEGHPLRKDFPLTPRMTKRWPGLTEPGEPEAARGRSRRLAPPGVPDDWLPP